jgi:hypothetical protein
MSRFTTTAVALAGLLLASGAALGQIKPAPPPSTYDRDAKMLAWDPGWKKSFPNLANFEVLAPSTGKAGTKGAYNCIAHSLRIYTRWVWEGNKLSDFDRLYGQHGFRRIKTLDYRFDARYEKVVLYAKVGPTGELDCTHGSRQLTDGTWTSKLGAGPLIRHDTPESVSGPSYGKPVYVYIRPRKQPIIKPDAPSKPAATAIAGLTTPSK